MTLLEPSMATAVEQMYADRVTVQEFGGGERSYIFPSTGFPLGNFLRSELPEAVRNALGRSIVASGIHFAVDTVRIPVPGSARGV